MSGNPIGDISFILGYFVEYIVVLALFIYH